MSLLRLACKVVADLIRSAVRCTSPLLTLGAFVGLLFNAQGKDVLLLVLERAAPELGDSPQAALPGDASIDGLLFLGGATLLLSMSVWYSMRWLLTVQMRGLPLPLRVGPVREWAPRLFGALPLVAVAHASQFPNASVPLQQVGHTVLVAFYALAIAFVCFCYYRGDLIARYGALRGTDAKSGRQGEHPGVLLAGDPLPKLTLRVMLWSVMLSFMVALLLVAYPQSLSRVIGTAAIVALALTSINLFGSFVLSFMPLRVGLPPLGPLLFVVAGVVLAPFNDNHIVQPVPGAGAPPESWRADHDAKFFTAPMPPIFVASEGGGIRAAYWTAAVLEALDKEMSSLEQARAAKERLPQAWIQSLYALSGVSGGSLGVSAWLAVNRERWCDLKEAYRRPVSWAGQPLSASQLLGVDFLSPAVSGMLYQDLLQRFLPYPIASFDRSRGLEEGWQRAFASLPGRPFSRPLHEMYERCPNLPRLILNTTAVETGQHVPLSMLSPDLFVNSLDVMTPLTDVPSQSLAGLVHHSARFPVLSPAGTVSKRGPGATPEEPLLARPWVRLVDGGYFDNSGVQAVLDVLRHPPFKPVGASGAPMKPILLVIRNDPSPLCSTQGSGHAAATAHKEVVPSNVFPEVGSIVSGLYNARSAHAATARKTARNDTDIITLDLSVGAGSDASRAPLGWALSLASRRKLDQEAAQVARRVAPQLARALRSEQVESCR